VVAQFVYTVCLNNLVGCCIYFSLKKLNRSPSHAMKSTILFGLSMVFLNKVCIAQLFIVHA